MKSFEELIKARNEKNTYAIFMGINTTDMREGYAEGEIELRKEHLNPMNSVHGGCIFSLADTVAGSASVSYGYKTATITSSMNFISAAVNTKKIVAKAEVVKRGKKTTVVNATIYDDREKIVAIGTFTFFNTDIPFLED